MKTRQRTGMSLVLELVSYTLLTAFHLWGGSATTLPYSLLMVAIMLRMRWRFRHNRKNPLNSDDSSTS